MHRGNCSKTSTNGGLAIRNLRPRKLPSMRTRWLVQGLRLKRQLLPKKRLPMHCSKKRRTQQEIQKRSSGVTIDATIARGLDYYTGVIYETRLTDPRVASIGAVMSGGRYDDLIGMFGKEQLPAVGISLGLDRLLAALGELNLLDEAHHGADVFVAGSAVFGADDPDRMVRRLRELAVAAAGE